MAPSRLLSPRLVAAAACAATVFVALPSVATAHEPHFRGVVPAATRAGRAYQAKAHPASSQRHGGSNLQYHGGPVMHTDANYIIYWAPANYSFSSKYQSVINGFFQNVATASGSTSNDYGVVRQYYDSTGNSAYSVSDQGVINDTTPYPASGCSAGGGGPCITDAQLQQHLTTLLAGYPHGLSTEYFVYFPSGVTTCFDGSGTQCSGTTYCAYHSNDGTGNTAILYANMPYAGVSGCESGEYPQGDIGGDSVVNVTSHENIETITDPLGTAWYDASGNEIGDKCAWNFGSALGGAPGAEYNEQIGGSTAANNYWLQREWSNASSSCVQRY